MRRGSMLDMRTLLITAPQHLLQSRLDDSIRVNGVGSSATMFVLEAERMIMLGLLDDARELLIKAKQWFQVACDTDEYSRVRPREHMTEYYKYEVYSNYAMCNWLLTGKHDAENTKTAADSLEAAFRLKQYLRMRRVEMAEMMLCFLETSAYATFIKWYDLLGFRRPTNVVRASGSASVAYIVAEHCIRRKQDRESVIRQVRKFLVRLVPADSPYFNLVAKWVKLLHCHLMETHEETAFELFGQYRRYLWPE
jgi:hypothetical protein